MRDTRTFWPKFETVVAGKDEMCPYVSKSKILETGTLTSFIFIDFTSRDDASRNKTLQC